MAFGNSVKLGNIKENWLFDIKNRQASYLYFAFSPVTYNSNFYYGVILNSPTIRENIDLKKSTSKTSGLSITIPDFTYKGSPISKELFGGTNNYINQITTVKSQINNDTPVTIASLRLINISSNSKTITISFASHRAWDFIEFPINKTTSNNIIIPVFYGNYTANSATTFASPAFEATMTRKSYRPVPYNITKDEKALYIDGSATTDGELSIYEKGLDIFVPLEHAEGSLVDTDNVTHSQIEYLQKRSFKQRASGYTNSGFTNPDNAIDTSTSTYASKSIDVEQTSSTSVAHMLFKVSEPSGMKNSYFLNTTTLAEDLTTTETGVDVTSATGIVAYDIIKINAEEMRVTSVSSNTLTVTRGFNSTTATSHDDNDEVKIDHTVNVVGVKWEIVISDIAGNLSGVAYKILTEGANFNSVKYTSSQSAQTIYVNLTSGTSEIKVQAEFTTGATGEDDRGDLDASFRIFDVFLLSKRISEEPEDMLYSGNDGLTHGMTGISGAITEIHEAHLDLLNRFTGLDVATNPATNISGWNDLNTAKDWAIRYWVHEITNLKDVLEKLQYEGGFIFRYKADGTPQYIFIKDSYSGVDVTLTKNDLANITVKPSSFSELVTKMRIDHKKHPALSGHTTTTEATNSTAVTNWNIQSLENIESVKLDAYVSPAIPTSPASNPNDDFYTYYDNIFGDIKIIVSGEIVNPSKWVDSSLEPIDVGSVINFDNMIPETPFGYNSASWSGLTFMITSLSRSRGVLKFEAREIKKD